MRVARLVLPCLIVLLLVAAGPAGAAERTVPRGFYGAMWDGPGTASPAGDAQWGAMAASGVESARTVFSWAAAQPERDGRTDFTATDRVVANAARARITLLPVVIYTPDWAKADPVENAPPADPQAYAAYLRRLIQRYGPAGTFWAENPGVPRRPVREWQLWNEPHLRQFWNYPGETRTGVWVKPYGALVRASARAIRRADPGAKVVLGGMTNDAWNHLDRLLRSGGVRGSFDVAAIQTYTGTPRRLIRAINLVRAVMRKRGVSRRPLWLTEMSWPAARGRVDAPSYQRSIITTDRGMATRVRDSYALLARVRRQANVRVGRAYWYTWSSNYDAADGSVFRFAGLTRFDGERFVARPALRAYRASARRHEGCAKTTSGTCR